MAQSPGIERLFPERPSGYVTDVAGVVDPASRQEMESLVQRLRGATGAEIAIVTLPTIGDYAPVDVAVALGRKWGVGAAAEIGDERRNAGLVVLLVPRREGDDNSGHIFIATGKGVEGIVTDAEAGRVRDRMVPELRRGEYGPGLLTGVRSLVSTLARGFGVEDSTLVDRDRQLAAERGRPSATTLLLGLFVGMVVLSLVIS
ncbi:MAG: TPM domain-containing protein, partial [Gemmatimonadales bacterium]